MYGLSVVIFCYLGLTSRTIASEGANTDEAIAYCLPQSIEFSTGLYLCIYL